nr:MAG TPA: hypothetical protein [Microviridae sp.]
MLLSRVKRRHACRLPGETGPSETHSAARQGLKRKARSDEGVRT